MKQSIFRVLLVLFFVLTVTLVFAEYEIEIPISELPGEILEAAQEAVPGIQLIEAEITETREGVYYEVEGILDGKWYEIQISADGTILEGALEEGNETEEDEDGKDDDED